MVVSILLVMENGSKADISIKKVVKLRLSIFAAGTMKDNEIKLIRKKCKGCDKTFGVTEKSPQKYHSDECEALSTNRYLTEIRPIRLPTTAEAIYIMTGKRPLDGKNFSTMKNLEIEVDDEQDKEN